MVSHAGNQFQDYSKSYIMKGFYLKWLTVFIGILVLAASCRKDDPVLPSEPTLVNPWEQVTGDIYGFFLLNEGNMGTNQASLDYYDYETGVYTRNIYGERNPYEVKDPATWETTFKSTVTNSGQL